MKYCYTLKRQHADPRDWRFPGAAGLSLPEWVDQRAKTPWGGCPGIFDQLRIGACAPNAAVSAVAQLIIKEQSRFVDLSRLDTYWNARALEFTTASDSGSSIRDNMKALAAGVCREDLWPYGNGSTFAVGPSAEAIANSPLHKLKSYLACANVDEIKQSLALGFPVVIGIEVFRSFEDVSSDGMVPMPAPSESFLGAHGIKIVGYGYRNGCQRFIFANSWSQAWGDRGYGYIPFDYISKLAWDFWTPRLY